MQLTACLRQCLPSSPSTRIEIIRTLRSEYPGLPFTRAKQAADAGNNSYEAALQWLRSTQAAYAADRLSKLSTRATPQSLMALRASPDRRQVNLMEVQCETDFVARSSLFVQFCTDMLRRFEGNSRVVDDDADVKAMRADIASKVGENVRIKQWLSLGDPWCYGYYILHSSPSESDPTTFVGSLASVVAFESTSRFDIDKADRCAQNVLAKDPSDIDELLGSELLVIGSGNDDVTGGGGGGGGTQGGLTVQQYLGGLHPKRFWRWRSH